MASSATPTDEDLVPEGRTYGIDELAAAAGLPSRTVRHYQSEGLMAPPTRRGRLGVYDDGHLERLRVIAQLQERGLNLRTIRDALRHVDRGRLSLQEWLGVEADLSAAWLDESPEVLDEAGLSARLGDRPKRLRGELEHAGLLERAGKTAARGFVVPSPGLLDIALRLHDAGVDVGTGALAGEILRRRIRRACNEVVRALAERTGDGFARGTAAADVGEAMAALRAVGSDAVRIIFSQEIEAALQRGVTRGLIRPRRRERKRGRR